MDFFETPAAIQAEPSADQLSEVPAKAPEITPAMQVEAAAGVDAGFKAIKAQPKVKIRVPKVYGPQVVIINGARFNVPSNVFIEVPEQVAQILADAGRI
jgi:hypothetical protein